MTTRIAAWDRLGQPLAGAETADQAMEKAQLKGWDLRKLPVFAELPGGKRMQMPDRAALVRTNPVRRSQVDYLGDVGKGYPPIQNEHHAELLDALVDESGAQFASGGELEGGRKVFVTLRLPGHSLVSRTDPIECHLAALNSHDGSMAFTLMVTPIRVATQTVMNMPYNGATGIFRIRHTSGAEAAVRAQARQALDMTFNYMDELQQQAQKLASTPLTQQRFEKIVTAEFGAVDGASAAAVTRGDQKIDQMAELFANTQSQGLGATAWAGLAAMTEWADHLAPTRGSERDTARAAKAILDPSIKTQALRLMASAN